MRKKWWCHIGVKLVMVFIFIMGIIGIVGNVDRLGKELNTLRASSEYENYNFHIYMNYQIEDTLYLGYKAIVDYYGNGLSEESILAGEHINLTNYDEEVKIFTDNALSEKIQYLQISNIDYFINLNNEIIINNLDKNTTESVTTVFNRIDENLKQNIEKYKESVIRTQLSTMQQINKTFEEYKDSVDYVVYLKDNTVKTNLNIELNDLSVVNYFNERTYSDDYNIAYKDPMIGGEQVTEITPESISEVFIAISDTYLANMEQEKAISEQYTKSVDKIYTSHITDIAMLSIATLLALIYLILTAGQRVNDNEVHLLIYDKIYGDIGVIMIFLLSIFSVVLIDQISIYDSYNNTIPYINVIYTISVIFGLIILGMIMSFSKHIKRHEFFKHTLIYKVTSYTYSKIRNFIIKVKTTNNSINNSIKGTIILGMIANIILILFCLILSEYFFNTSTFGILVMGLFGFICEYSIVCQVIATYQKDLENLKNGVSIIKNGNLDYQIKNMNHTSIKAIANDINLISDGLNLSVKKAVESEKMKSELVTNVSHDLKTPLTSIINYVDLLSKKESMDDDAKHYLNVLIDKSNQLKKLVEDLFEMTKAQSGQIKVEVIPLCIDDLITQSLVEYEDKLTSKELDVRISALDHKCMVYADGNRTWRVLSNIISNICKYSLEKTRVYISYEEKDQACEITFKNISSYVMDFNGNEMTERFKRADDSRNSEGNGLGLAIASSFMELQNASLDIIVDGDLFKAKLTFKRVINNDNRDNEIKAEIVKI